MVVLEEDFGPPTLPALQATGAQNLLHSQYRLGCLHIVEAGKQLVLSHKVLKAWAHRISFLSDADRLQHACERGGLIFEGRPEKQKKKTIDCYAHRAIKPNQPVYLS